ncbi:MAG: DUF1343 domain-containing protein, partial [Verrucomicrobia bacterium]
MAGGNAFFEDVLRQIDQTILEAIQEGQCPGAVLWLEREGAVYRKAYGHRALVPAREPMTEDTIFDLASLTKVVALTPAVMRLVEEGKLDLNAPVVRYLPEFGKRGKEKITIRQLLTHTSGLRPDISLSPEWSGTEAALRLACEERPWAGPDERFIYSDTGPIVLGEIVRRLSGRPLDQFAEERLFRPLGMNHTAFNPPAAWRPKIAPTSIENGKPLRGVVHDPRARRMGGVAGHAGLFSCAEDLARFARMMLNEGRLGEVRVFRPETVRMMTRVQTPPNIPQRRGLGWDIDSPYAGQRGDIFPIGGYGHTGWTGCSIWIDPFSRTFVILLTNRNHPDGKGNVIGLRRRVGTLAAKAIRGFNFHHVPGALEPLPAAAKPEAAPSRETVEVRNGIDVLVEENFAPLKGLRVGLITNHTGVDRRRRPTIDLLHAATNVTLVALFSPEHGIRGEVDAHVADGVDERTGLPVYSLYDDTRQPKPEELRGLDALVFDIQDIGTRFYTYISTMGLCLEAAARAGLKFFVLDRVNPITGVAVEGPVYQGDPMFTAFHALPVRHGMTVGELARMFAAERGWKVDLQVIPIRGWRRELWFDQTSLPWVNPSPNMRSLTEAILYPGIGLLETTRLSVGRGTDTPFEVVGAPYIDDVRLAAELNRMDLEGLAFIPTRFTPRASVFAGKECGGVRIMVLDRDHADVLGAGLAIATILHRLYPEDFGLERFDKLLRYEPALAAIRENRTPAEIKALWRRDLAAFRERRAR